MNRRCWGLRCLWAVSLLCAAPTAATERRAGQGRFEPQQRKIVLRPLPDQAVRAMAQQLACWRSHEVTLAGDPRPAQHARLQAQ